MSMLPPVFVELKANVSEFTTAMGEARTQVASLENKSVSSFDKLATFGKAALFGLGTAAVGVGALGVKMAEEFETSHAKLQAALKNSGTTFDAYATQIGDAQKHMEQFGFTNAQTQEALANMTTALKDPKKALDDLSLAADLAKFKHIDLASAATAVARAQEGNLRALKALGIDLPIAATNAASLAKAHDALAKATDNATAFINTHAAAYVEGTKAYDQYQKLLDKVTSAQDAVNVKASAGTEIMKGLADAIGGQAATQAETFSGKMAALKAQSEDVAKNIGMALIPILEKLVSAIKDVVDWFGKHKVVAEALGVVIGTVLVASIGAYLYSLGAAAAASVVHFAEMISGWVGLGAAEDVATAGAIGFNIATGGIVLAIGAVIAAVVLLATHWRETWDMIKRIAEDVGKFLELIFNGIGNQIKNVINSVIDLVNVGIRAIDAIHVKLPDILGGFEIGFNIPQIPHLAQGGIVNSPTIALIGEAGPEAVVPLSKMGGMGGGLNVVVNVQGSVVQEHDLAITVRDQIAQMMRRRGLSPSILGV
jgi:hypothetical protein